MTADCELTRCLRVSAPSVHGIAAGDMQKAADLIDELLAAAKALKLLYETGWISVNGIDIGYEEHGLEPFRDLFAAIAKAEGRK